MARGSAQVGDFHAGRSFWEEVLGKGSAQLGNVMQAALFGKMFWTTAEVAETLERGREPGEGVLTEVLV